MAKLLASFKNRENALALQKELMNQVRHVWVCVFTPTKSNQYYDVDVQGSNDLPCTQDKFAECENVRDTFTMPEPETIIVPNVDVKEEPVESLSGTEDVRL